jgi:hypothetical protein
MVKAMTDPIRTALEVAACALCREAKSCRGDCGGLCLWRVPDVSMPACAAAAIAAFLRSLPDDADFVLPSLGAIGRAFPVATLADAVLAAAKGQAND